MCSFSYVKGSTHFVGGVAEVHCPLMRGADCMPSCGRRKTKGKNLRNTHCAHRSKICLITPVGLDSAFISCTGKAPYRQPDKPITPETAVG
jgi:hypothetical protein